jgi:hypothetical protein
MRISKMYHLLTTLLFLTFQVLSAQSGQPNCPILFDGRIPGFAQTSDFDKSSTPFRDGLKPSNTPWSSILSFAQVPPSLFDRDHGSKGLEIQITDKSIVSRLGQSQSAYRRSDLVLDDASSAKVKTYHWSVGQGLPLNLTHFYVNVYVDKKEATGESFLLGLGRLEGTSESNWKIAGRDRSVKWQTPVIQGEWQNFAVTLDYERKYVHKSPCFLQYFLPISFISCSSKQAVLTRRVFKYYESVLLQRL